MSQSVVHQPVVFQGQFGEYTITDRDRQGVLVYRVALLVAAIAFAMGSGLALWQGADPTTLRFITPLYTVFVAALGVALWTIHIYMAALHRTLQLFWVVGVVGAIAAAHLDPQPFVQTVYESLPALFGVGFTFAALTGIYFKEAFCFNRLETKVLTPLVPFLLLGHLVGWLPILAEQVLLGIWAVLMLIFAIRKFSQPAASDIGDKSVFEYLQTKH
ncbi:DUF2301 domain-containing membrane protein [Leptolyngbya sp. AN02str]|uniref:DUF2301 domain-containing membrane protein n=1 Tax=Leptolyngbya sp. AN02str TaxID=3423363 RepID=UPI003D31A4D7